MSMAENDITPTMTGGATPTTQTGVPVTTGPLMSDDSGTIPKSMAVLAFCTPSGPRYHDGILYQQNKMYQHLYQQQPLQWGHFNPDSTEETECSDRHLEEDEKYNVDARVEALEKGQQEMKKDLEEVILTIPDMVI
ncbi:UNVERIFIED_CONTAM: hypothetical protein K2H54_014342 [Gekko kuhli]